MGVQNYNKFKEYYHKWKKRQGVPNDDKNLTGAEDAVQEYFDHGGK